MIKDFKALKSQKKASIKASLLTTKEQKLASFFGRMESTIQVNG